MTERDDITPMLPMLRAEVAESGVEMLVGTLVHQVYEGWLVDQSKCNAIASARAGFVEACERYRVCTGEDGIAYARAYSEEKYGVAPTMIALGFLKKLAKTLEGWS